MTVEIRSGPGSGGAGVVWDPDGLIVTNAHVVAVGAAPQVRLADGRVLRGQVCRRDTSCDLAMIAVDARNLSTAQPAPAAGPGQLVVAIGHPFGMPNAVAVGVVHAMPRSGPHPLDRLLRIDLRLAPGNSGGPVADARGRLLGISTMIVNGLAHAIPSDSIAGFVRGSNSHRVA